MVSLLLGVAPKRKDTFPHVGRRAEARAREAFARHDGEVHSITLAKELGYSVKVANNFANRLRRRGLVTHEGYVRVENTPVSLWRWKDESDSDA